jgi:hypothetical protein
MRVRRSAIVGVTIVVDAVTCCPDATLVQRPTVGWQGAAAHGDFNFLEFGEASEV